MTLGLGGDGPTPLEYMFKALKAKGTTAKVVKNDDGTFYRRVFAINEYSLDLSPVKRNGCDIIVATWDSAISYTHDVQSYEEAKVRPYDDTDFCNIEWKAIFRLCGKRLKCEDVLYRIYSLDKMGDAKTTKDKRHYVFDWIDEFNNKIR